MNQISRHTLFAATWFLIGIPGLRCGTLYEADNGSGRILSFTSNGVASTFASGLSYPTGLALDAGGNLYETDGGTNKIFKFTPAGVQSTFASGLNAPDGLAFDSAGNLYVADWGSGQILKFTATGVESVFASGLSQPTSLAFDAAGDLFVGEDGARRITEFTPGGVPSAFASGSTPTCGNPGELRPVGLAFDTAGNLYESDACFQINKFSPAGLESAFGITNSSGGLAFDGSGDLFEADYLSSEILKFTPVGVRSTFADQLTAGVVLPTSLAFENSASVPEPTGSVLMGAGLAALARLYFRGWRPIPRS